MANRLPRRRPGIVGLSGWSEGCFEHCRLRPAIMAAISSTSGHCGMHEVTRILNAIDLGDSHAAEQLFCLCRLFLATVNVDGSAGKPSNAIQKMAESDSD